MPLCPLRTIQVYRQAIVHQQVLGGTIQARSKILPGCRLVIQRLLLGPETTIMCPNQIRGIILLRVPDDLLRDDEHSLNSLPEDFYWICGDSCELLSIERFGGGVEVLELN